MTICENIKALYTAKSLTHETISRITGIDQARLHKYAIGLKAIPEDDLHSLAGVLNIPDNDIKNPDFLSGVSRADKNLLAFAQEFQTGCGLRPYLALAAIETYRIANQPELFNFNTTRYVPPMPREYGTSTNDHKLIKLLACFHAILRPEKLKGCLSGILESAQYANALLETVTLWGIPACDDYTRGKFRDIARLYTAYIIAGIDPESMTCSEIEDLIDEAVQKPCGQA